VVAGSAYLVVDAFNFLRDYSSRDSLQDRGESPGEEDQRTVVELLIEQIEFWDVIVLNKVDLISNVERERLMAIPRKLNPSAQVEISNFVSKYLLLIPGAEAAVLRAQQHP
jgi:G3E family GTPase